MQWVQQLNDDNGFLSWRNRGSQHMHCVVRYDQIRAKMERKNGSLGVQRKVAEHLLATFIYLLTMIT